MRKILLTTGILAFFIVPLQALQKLPEDYRVFFGNPEAKTKVTEYFSFACPNCITLFREDFPEIKKKHIDEGKLYFEFHPIPVDMTTVQAMICLEKLNEKEKAIFLSVLLEEAEDDPEINCRLMKKAMEVFNKPIPNLGDKESMTKTRVFNESLQFLTQDDRIEAVPSVSLNGVYYEDETPSLGFISKNIEKLETFRG